MGNNFRAKDADLAELFSHFLWAALEASGLPPHGRIDCLPGYTDGSEVITLAAGEEPAEWVAKTLGSIAGRIVEAVRAGNRVAWVKLAALSGEPPRIGYSFGPITTPPPASPPASATPPTGPR